MRFRFAYIFEWVPSHNASFFDCLQPQKYAVVDSVAVYLIGVIPDSLWLPSQKGCEALRPQAHQ
jgi:hypothetical protein